MPTAKAANDQSSSTEWVNVPDGLYRWKLQKPVAVYSEKYGNWRVRFPLVLTDEERKRVDEQAELKEGQQQSYRASYTVGLFENLFGYYPRRSDQFKPSKIAEIFAPAFGMKNQREVWDWIKSGGVPHVEKVETCEACSKEANGPCWEHFAQQVVEWLAWLEDLEIYGEIKNENGWANWGKPLAVGALPGQPERDYQSFGRGKFHGMIASLEGTPTRTDGTAAEQGVAEGVAAKEEAQAVYSANGLRLDDHDHPEQGVCDVCYERLFTTAKAPAGAA